MRVILVGVKIGEDADFEHTMEELGNLAEACGKTPVGIVTQNLEQVSQTYYVGSGKVDEIKELAGFQEAEEIIFDDTLTPSQARNLGNRIEKTILDRTSLILEIFAMRAKTKEAKLQVEMARLQYMLPRLIGMREALGRQGGASGAMSSMGAGETKLELDRRKIEHRISELRKELETLSGNRATMRSRRDASGIPKVALVGYTNAGKSTIMNRMVAGFGTQKDKTVLEKDMLFATLDTSVRSMEFSDHRRFLLADTVGFIHKLPHSLVKAFRSTLEEVKYADLLVHVVDFSDEHHKQQMEVTQETLRELDAAGIPQLIVYNKADLAGTDEYPRIHGNQIYMAAAKDCGIEELAGMIRDRLYADNRICRFLFPYKNGSEASELMRNSDVREKEYVPEGVVLLASCGKRQREKFRKYLVEEEKCDIL